MEDEEYGRTVAVNRAQLMGGADLQDLGHFLVVLAGNDPGRRVLLGPTPITVGRDAARDLVLDDSEASRSHLRVSVVSSGVLIEDLNSTNGTYVRGRLDSPGVDRLETRFIGTIVRDGRQALIDLSQVEFIASLGVRMLISAARAVARRGGRLVLLAPTEPVREMFEHVSPLQH